MPLLVAAIVAFGSFIGYTLNDIDNNQTHVEIVQQTPLVLDFQCRDNQIGQEVK